MNNNAALNLPKLDVLETELKRTRYQSRYRKIIRSTLYTLMIVAAVAVLIATLWLPVLQVYGSSMTPTLHDGNIVISVSGSSYSTGDVIAFYYNNKILIKRVIAQPGEWVDIDEDGNVFVNGEKIEEPYVSELALGDCNIALPFQVPEDRIFVMGDHRSVSVDSRNKSIGCIAKDEIVGRLVCRVWPLKEFGSI